VNEGVILSEVDREAINFVEGSAVAFRNFRFGGHYPEIRAMRE
jgi:hypothetical protein